MIGCDRLSEVGVSLMSLLTTYTSPGAISAVYRMFRSQKDVKSHILEPLQALLQIAYLDFCPLGTKISIKDHILSIQPPQLTQGVIRWYNVDKKENIHFLFAVFNRYVRLYMTCPRFSEFVARLNPHILGGLSNLEETYKETDNSIRQILRMFKAILKIAMNSGASGSIVSGGDLNAQLLGVADEDTSTDEMFRRLRDNYSQELIAILSNGLIILEGMESVTGRIEFIYGLEKLQFVERERIQNTIKNSITV